MWGRAILLRAPRSAVRFITRLYYPVLGYDPSDLNSSTPFSCDLCAAHRSSVTPRTPEDDHGYSAFRGPSSSTIVTLGNVVRQLKHSHDVMQQLKHSSGVANSKLGLIQDSLAGMECTMAGIRSSVADLSVSHQLLSETGAALEARVDAAYPDSPRARGERLALGSQLSELSPRLSSIESSRGSPDIIISGIPASITYSPRTTVLRILEALWIPELAVDVLDVRSRSRKDVSAIGDHQRRSAVFIVTLKSFSIHHVIYKKYKKGNLTVEQVLALDQPVDHCISKRILWLLDSLIVFGTS